MSAKVTDTDRGYGKLMATVRTMGAAKGRAVAVGIQGAEAGAKTAKGGDLTVADVAAFHEFGMGNNPERSWLRAWFDENETANRELLRRAVLAVIKGDTTTDAALAALGAAFVGQIQQRISAGIDPPLAAATVARKGSSTPLIDTGQLRSSITSKVE